MTFPAINHIDDVLPFVTNRKDFVVARKDGYTVIDYVFATDDTFDHPMRRECRGLKFAEDGSLLARPLHKFFNIGEREETQTHLLDFTRPHTIMEKLDGSMIHPAIVGGEVVLMTRMGRTDVARKAERHLPDVADFCRGILLGGATPIFEWTAPDNRIVVRYPDSALTLLAVRNNTDGTYWPHATLVATGLPTVSAPASTCATSADFLAYARAITGKEGFVVRWADGTMVKAKGEDYVLKHRAKDSVMQEKNLLALVLAGGLDDVLPLLDEADAAAAREYAADVLSGIEQVAANVTRYVAANDNRQRGDFARAAKDNLPPYLLPVSFQVLDGKDAASVIRSRIAANCNSQTKVDECRALHGAVWSS